MQALLISLRSRQWLGLGVIGLVTVMLVYPYLIGMYQAHPVTVGSRLLFHNHGQPCSKCH